MLPTGAKPLAREDIKDAIEDVLVWGNFIGDKYVYGVDDIGNAIYDTTDFNSIESVKESIQLLEDLEAHYNKIMISVHFLNMATYSAAEKVGRHLASAIRSMAARYVPEKVIIYPEHVCNQGRMRAHY